MAANDAAGWNERYAGSDMATPCPPRALVEAGLVGLVAGPATSPDAPDKSPAGPDASPDGARHDAAATGTRRALDIACGTGAQTLWLVRQDMRVTALDVSFEAIALLRSSIDRDVPEDRVDARVVDLDHGLPADLGRFDVIVCQLFRDPNLYPAIVEHLAPGGIAVMTVLSRTGAADPGPFHAQPGELAAAFADTEVLFRSEADGEESVVARRPARSHV